MKRVLKKNRLMITVLAVMVAAAGYLNYNGANLNKAKETDVAQTAEISLNQEDIDSMDFDITDTTALLNENQAAAGKDQDGSETETIEGETVTSTLPVTSEAEESQSENSTEENGSTDESSQTTGESLPGETVLTSAAAAYVTQARLEREQVRSQNKEVLQSIINNKDLSESEIQKAVNSLSDLTDCAEKEAAAETLLEAQGFKNAVVSMTGDTVDVVVDAASLDETGKARIEDAVKRKTGVSVENIVITPVRSE